MFSAQVLQRRWASFHNRGERVVSNPSGCGYECDWEWTSDLTLPRVFPAAGRSLLLAALSERPFAFAGVPPRAQERSPIVSFIVGHRGVDRLPLLLATLASLGGQAGCEFEVLVVEQSTESVLEGRLPADVRLIRQVPLEPGLPYSRSSAFNRGVREARGRIVVLHDNDIVVPSSYAKELCRLEAEGFEAMRLMRYLFYLDEEGTEILLSKAPPSVESFRVLRPSLVRQNCQGGTIAVTRDAYLRVGGHDEGFIGWGGEDNEFFDRCRLLRFHPWGYLPFVHLWHAPQPDKGRSENPRKRLLELMAIPREERAKRLKRAGGDAS
jgi:GT2 family glycosyltransferase